MLVIGIDGACRRNGKPDCVSAGGVFIQHLDADLNIINTAVRSNYELKSTNQRGELLALLTSMDYAHEVQQSAQIITDSEYIFNTLTKEWNKSWMRKGWITAGGEPVKNQDIWLEITSAQRKCDDKGPELTIYHIKGHAMSFGKVTAQNLLKQDETGRALYDAVYDKLCTVPLKDDILQQVIDLSVKNNGFELDGTSLKRFIATNIVADAVATKCVEAADALMK